MARTPRGPIAAIGIALAIALVAVVGVVSYYVHTHRPHETTFDTLPADPKSTQKASPQSAPASNPASIAKEEKHQETGYMDVVRATYPAFPTTQPLATPIDLSQAARIVLNDPLYLGTLRGDLWITRKDALPIERVLHQAIDPNTPDPQSHILGQRVAYVHWMPDESGTWPPYLVCPTADGDFEIIWEHGRAKLPAHRDFRWDRAYSWNEKVVVPSALGISVFVFGQPVKESFHQLIFPREGATQPATGGLPQALIDSKGHIIAWAPWENGLGSRGAARYIEPDWTPLGPDQGWPEKIAYLVPLLDGTVFQFVSDADGGITVQNTALEAAPDVDETAVKKLVEQLGDVDQDVRHEALTKLSNFGPGIWPLLEKLQNSQPPQAKLLIGQLLKDRNRPTLSGMTLLGKRTMTLVSRLSDGGVVLYAEQGVSIPETEDTTTTIAPAWLSVRPGHYVELLSPALVNELKPDSAHFEVVADQWLVNSDVRGPRLFFGNGLATLLRKDEQDYTRVIGMDQMGRWLFRKSDDASRTGPTLLIDPHLPDPTPRLPVWQLAIAETVGWDKDNWPAMKNGSVYALTDSEWRPIEDEKQFFTSSSQPAASTTQPNPASQPPAPPASQPALPSTSQPALPPTSQTASPSASQSVSQSTAQPAADDAILKSRDGSRFFDGLTELRMTDKDGKSTTWPLPAIANGAGPVTLIETPDGKLFLFNQPGRVLRIARTPRDAEPFKIEATFTHNIPSAANPTRIWLDPAGRIDIAYGARIAILFPAGYIPQPIMQKIADRSGLDVEGL